MDQRSIVVTCATCLVGAMVFAGAKHDWCLTVQAVWCCPGKCCPFSCEPIIPQCSCDTIRRIGFDSTAGTATQGTCPYSLGACTDLCPAACPGTTVNAE